MTNVASEDHAGSRSASNLRLVTFEVCGDLLALDIMGIVQIIKYEGSTEVPQAPAFLEGIIVLRDQVIPLIDLRKRLFPKAETDDENKRVLIVHLGEVTVGLKVDSVERIVAVEDAEILPAPPLVQGMAARFFRGVVRINGAVVLLVDLERILTRAETRELEGASQLLDGSA